MLGTLDWTGCEHPGLSVPDKRGGVSGLWPDKEGFLTRRWHVGIKLNMTKNLANGLGDPSDGLHDPPTALVKEDKIIQITIYYYTTLITIKIITVILLLSWISANDAN